MKHAHVDDGDVQRVHCVCCKLCILTERDLKVTHTYIGVIGVMLRGLSGNGLVPGSCAAFSRTPAILALSSDIVRSRNAGVDLEVSSPVFGCCSDSVVLSSSELGGSTETAVLPVPVVEGRCTEQKQGILQYIKKTCAPNVPFQKGSSICINW